MASMASKLTTARPAAASAAGAEANETRVAEAKAYLAQIDKDGKSVYDHLSSVLYALLEQRPDAPLSILDVVSRDIGREVFVPPRPIADQVEALPSAEMEAAFSAIKTQSDLFARTGAVFGYDHGGDDGYEEPVDAEVNDGYLPDIIAEAGRFEECGVSLSREEAYRVMLALKRLVEAEPLDRVRFFGKIFGRQHSYYIAETVYKDGARPFDEADAEAAGEDVGEEYGDTNYSLGEGPSEGGADGEREGYRPPKATWKAPPVPPMEEAVGANKYVYWVCTLPGAPWTRLPDVKPKHIVGARAIRKLFTGDLATAIHSYPPFPGTERELLRAQIARINAATAIAPLGRYVDPAENGSGGGDEDDALSAVSAEEYDPSANEEIGTAAGWVHRERCILPQGRCFWWQPPREEPAADGSEDPDEDGSAAGPPPETGPRLLASCAEDAPHGPFDAWTARLSSKVAPRYATTLLQSNVWPGAYAFMNGRASACVYVGNGVKALQAHYTPPLPAAPAVEFSDKAAVTERTDATVADEDARNAEANPEGDELSYGSGDDDPYSQ